MKKILITAFTLMAFLLAAQSAQAIQLQGDLKVVTYGKGKVVGQGIDCGSDCTETVTWDESSAAPSVLLTASGTAEGWGPTSYSGCSSLPANGKCLVNMAAGASKTVTIYFFDIQPPTTRIAGYSPAVGDEMYLNVEASDNEAVTKVEYLVDDEVIATRTSDYFTSAIDVSEVPEGPHEVKVRAWDGNHNSSDSLTYTINFDHTKPVAELDSPVDYTNAAAPAFSFDAPGEEEYWADCVIQRPGGTDEMTSCGYGEPYSQEIAEEGQWEFVVDVSDEVGNTTRLTHSFVVDRTAPVADFTSGPADGSIVDSGQAEYAWSATDDSPITQVCSWDGEDATSCDGSASRTLAAGEHSLKVTVTDKAGNATTLTRTLTAQGTPDPDPDTTDRTAPVVKLIAPKQNVKSLGKALRLTVRCNEACSGKVVVKGSGLKFAGRVYLAKAGAAKLKLRPAAPTRRSLKRILVRSLRGLASSPLKLTAKASLNDKAGNTGRASLNFRVTR